MNSKGGAEQQEAFAFAMTQRRTKFCKVLTIYKLELAVQQPFMKSFQSTVCKQMNSFIFHTKLAAAFGGNMCSFASCMRIFLKMIT